MALIGSRALRLSLIVSSAALLVACGSSSSKSNATAATTVPAASGTATTASGSATTTSKVFKVADVEPSTPNDEAFSQAMADGITGTKQQYNISLATSSNQFVVNDAVNAMQKYASQGYDLVIANGSQYNASVLTLAKNYPNTSFLVYGAIADTSGLPNVFAYQALANQGGYVQGVMASMLSKNHKIGEVGPIAAGDGQLYIDGFKAGALAQNSTANVKVNYTGSFSDVSLAATTAKSFVATGVDEMTGTAQMVVGAIGVCKQDNVGWFGTQSNQGSLAPQQVISSQVYHVEVALKQILAAISSGTKGGKAYDLSLSNAGEVIEYNSGFNLPANVKSQADQTISGIENGSITVPQ
jgi:basic membrane protein A